MHVRRTLFYHALLLALGLSMAGCDAAGLEDGPSVDGSYQATAFSVGDLDALAEGVTLTMTLSDGSVSGRFVVPASLDDDGTGDYDLRGTYAVEGDRVSFEQEADTFVRDADWVLQGETLRGTFGDLEVVLER